MRIKLGNGVKITLNPITWLHSVNVNMGIVYGLFLGLGIAVVLNYVNIRIFFGPLWLELSIYGAQEAIPIALMPFKNCPEQTERFSNEMRNNPLEKA